MYLDLWMTFYRDISVVYERHVAVTLARLGKASSICTCHFGRHTCHRCITLVTLTLGTAVRVPVVPNEEVNAKNQGPTIKENAIEVLEHTH